jgi:hypothetical protein
MFGKNVVETELYTAVKGNSESFVTILYAGTVNAPFVALHASQ